MSLLYPGVQGQKFKPFSKIDLSDAESCFSDMLNMIESSKFLAVRDGLFVNGRFSRISLTFKFLTAYTIGAEFLLEKKICLFQLDWCSQVVFSGVMRGEVLTNCVGLQMKLICL